MADNSFYGIAGKIDVTIWAVWLTAVNLTNLYILFLKTKKDENVPVRNNDISMDSENDKLDIRLINFQKFYRKTLNHCSTEAFFLCLKLLNIIFLCLTLNYSIQLGMGFIK